MSHQVWVRPYDEEKDKKLLVEWLYAGRHGNRFDPELFLGYLLPDKKKLVEIFTAFDEREILGFIPVRLAYVAESLAFKPGTAPVTEAKALQAWQRVMVEKMFRGAITDMFFVTYDADVLKFAQQYKWREVVVPMLNLHRADLEPKKPEATDGGTLSASQG